jgi:hypothetical protein
VATLVGVDQKTISNDLREENSSSTDKNSPIINDPDQENEENSSDAWFQRDVDRPNIALDARAPPGGPGAVELSREGR